MKKLKVLLFVLLLATLLGCSTTSESPIYAKLNDMSEQSYLSYSLEIITTIDNNQLHSQYDVNESNGKKEILYSYEKINEIELVDGEWIVPDEYSTKYVGSVTIENNKVVKQEGDKLDFDLQNINVINLSFAESYFTKVIYDDNSFKANVINAKSFINSDEKYKNMTTSILFNDNQFTSITISYTTDSSANIVIQYKFK